MGIPSFTPSFGFIISHPIFIVNTVFPNWRLPRPAEGFLRGLSRWGDCPLSCSMARDSIPKGKAAQGNSLKRQVGTWYRCGAPSAGRPYPSAFPSQWRPCASRRRGSWCTLPVLRIRLVTSPRKSRLPRSRWRRRGTGRTAGFRRPESGRTEAGCRRSAPAAGRG